MISFVATCFALQLSHWNLSPLFSSSFNENRYIQYDKEEFFSISMLKFRNDSCLVLVFSHVRHINVFSSFPSKNSDTNDSLGPYLLFGSGLEARALM